MKCQECFEEPATEIVAFSSDGFFPQNAPYACGKCAKNERFFKRTRLDHPPFKFTFVLKFRDNTNKREEHFDTLEQLKERLESHNDDFESLSMIPNGPLWSETSYSCATLEELEKIYMDLRPTKTVPTEKWKRRKTEVLVMDIFAKQSTLREIEKMN